jgi:hypothetical protein
MEQQDLLAIRQELVDKEKTAVAIRQSFDQFLQTSGVIATELSPNGHGHSEAMSDSMNGRAYPSLHGLPVQEALIAYAKSHGGIVDCTGCASAFIHDGVGDYQTKSAAYSSFYNLLKKDPRFTKIAPGQFRFSQSHGSPSSAGKEVVTHAKLQDGRNVPLPMQAKHRNYSVCELPPEFRNFNLNTIRNMHYKDATVAMARHVGGTITLQQVGRVFWHADLCGRAKSPGEIGAFIWTSSFAPHHGVFKQIGKGTYKLLV